MRNEIYISMIIFNIIYLSWSFFTYIFVAIFIKFDKDVKDVIDIPDNKLLNYILKEKLLKIVTTNTLIILFIYILEAVTKLNLKIN